FPQLPQRACIPERRRRNLFACPSPRSVHLARRGLSSPRARPRHEAHAHSVRDRRRSPASRARPRARATASSPSPCRGCARHATRSSRRAPAEVRPPCRACATRAPRCSEPIESAPQSSCTTIVANAALVVNDFSITMVAEAIYLSVMPRRAPTLRDRLRAVRDLGSYRWGGHDTIGAWYEAAGVSSTNMNAWFANEGRDIGFAIVERLADAAGVD